MRTGDAVGKTGIYKERGSGLDLSIVSKYRTEVYGMAILWIMLFHGYLVKVKYFTGIPLLQYVGRFISYGNMGVECFLFLSGIGLYFSFQRSRELHTFFWRRLCKVYPPVFLIGGTYWAAMFFLENRSGAATILSLTALRFWFDGNQEIWYCSLILLCYFAFPLIYSYLYRSSEDPGWAVLFRTLGLMMVIMLVTWSVSRTPSAKETYDNLEIALTRIPVFVLGCGCGRAVYQKKTVSNLWWAVMAFSALLCFLILESGEMHGIWRRWYYMAAGVPLVFLFSLLMKAVPGFLRKCFRFLGEMSLELYLMHLVLKRLYEHDYLPFVYRAGSVKRWLLLLVIAVLLSRLVWIAEKRIGMLLKKGTLKRTTGDA